MKSASSCVRRGDWAPSTKTAQERLWLTSADNYYYTLIFLRQVKIVKKSNAAFGGNSTPCMRAP